MCTAGEKATTLLKFERLNKLMADHGNSCPVVDISDSGSELAYEITLEDGFGWRESVVSTDWNRVVRLALEKWEAMIAAEVGAAHE